MKLARVAVLGVARRRRHRRRAGAQPDRARAPAVARAGQAGRCEHQQVLVAAKDIPMGTTLTPPSSPGRTGRRRRLRQVHHRRSRARPRRPCVGAIARATFYAGEPISDAKLIRSDRGFMSAILPAGKRAVATKIAADTSAGGFILPNDRVDVIMTRRRRPERRRGGPEYHDRNHPQQRSRPRHRPDDRGRKNGEKVVVGQTATLELTPQQAEILTVAQQMSDRLTLALRSIADSKSDADRRRRATLFI